MPRSCGGSPAASARPPDATLVSVVVLTVIDLLRVVDRAITADHLRKGRIDHPVNRTIGRCAIWAVPTALW
jgi:hypothetical protein